MHDHAVIAVSLSPSSYKILIVGAMEAARVLQAVQAVQREAGADDKLLL